MTARYSPSKGGNWPAWADYGDSIPDDLVDVPESDWLALVAGQSAGKVIIPGPGGYPILSDPPVATPDQLMAAVRDERSRLLTACDWTQVPDAPLTSSARAAWTAYRKALRDLPANTSDPANPTWPTAPQ